MKNGRASKATRVIEKHQLDGFGDELEADFVSYRAMHTYLRKYRGATRESPNTNGAETYIDSVDRLEILWKDCGSFLDGDELVEDGGCDCA